MSMKIKTFAHVLGSVLVLFTAVAHSVGTMQTPGAAERAVRRVMAENHPMQMAPNRSLLDFYVGNAWGIGILLGGLGALLLLGERTRRSALIGAITCAAMAGLSLAYFPTPPAICLGAAALAFLVGTFGGSAKASGTRPAEG